MSATGDTFGARDHARAQGGGVATAMPILPASALPVLPDGVDGSAMRWAETVAGGGSTSKVLARGTRIRLTDLTGDACAHVLLYNADQPWERLNAADTVKIPWQAYLGPGHPLLSDQGRVLATVVADSGGRHDALCGTTTRAAVAARQGDGSPQSGTPAGRELFILTAAKHGLEPRDLPPSVSFFQGVRVQGDGRLLFTGSAGPGATVELRCELPVVLLLANVPHPLDERPEYTCGPLEVLAWRETPTWPQDPLWSQSPEFERAMLNTADYVQARA